MQSRDFCYWLQGFFELNDGAAALTAEQAEIIRRHLDMVFVHEIAPLRAERPAPVPEPVVVPPPEPRPVPEPVPEPSPYPPPPTPLC